MFPKRIFKPVADYKKNIRFNHDSCKTHFIAREQSVTDEFYFETVFNADGTESVRIVDPIVMLFNQERIENMGTTAAKAFLDQFAQKYDAMAELRSKCSDEDLLTMIKSRHLQQPSEILSWCRYMKNNIDKFNDEVKQLVESQQQQQTEQTQVESLNTNV